MNKVLKSNHRSSANLAERFIGRITTASSLLLSLALNFPVTLARAQTSAEEPPLEENKLGIWIFAILFVGFCVGIVWFIWWNEKRKKSEQPKK